MLRFIGPFRPATFPIFSKPSLCTSFSQPICSISKSNPSASLKLQTPLFLRKPVHSTSLSDLKKWYQWAKQLTNSVGSSFVDLDNGPDLSLLCRELRWFMEDALVDHSLMSQMGVEDNKTTHLKNIKLRLEMDELYCLWKQRIEERKPFQYIVGCEHWRDLVLSVQEGILIPRPETEMIIDLVDSTILDSKELKEGLWADLGTGSGALAIGIGRLLQGSSGRVVATDLSPVAVAVAAFNVSRYGLENIIEIRQGSWFEPLEDGGLLAGLVSNPPYIPSDNISHLQAEVGRHEPRLALDGGVNGMDDLLRLCHGAAHMLKPGGFFTFETNGEKHCKFLVDYLDNELKGCFRNVRIVSDFAGVQRFVTGFRQETM